MFRLLIYIVFPTRAEVDSRTGTCNTAQGQVTWSNIASLVSKTIPLA